jgi:MFS family permease
MGIRHGFGLWLQPITMDRGWTRETFAFAMAVQNLAWGLAGPFAGMLADRFGAFRVLSWRRLLYALGLVLMALATSAWPSPAAPACCWAWRSRAPPTRWSTA